MSVVACASASNPCQEATCTGAGECIFRSRARGASCTRAGGAPGFCDGLQNGSSCVECVEDGGCSDDGNACTAARCSPNGACLHVPADGACTLGNGQAGSCQAADCGDVGCNSSETACNACSTSLCAALIEPGPCEEVVYASATTCRSQTLCRAGELCNPQTNQCEVPPGAGVRARPEPL